MEKKNILLGVCSSIAAYKSASLAHLLTKKGYNVDVIMTENATKIIAPITFERLTGNRCIVDTFEKTLSYDVKHISLAKSRYGAYCSSNCQLHWQNSKWYS